MLAEFAQTFDPDGSPQLLVAWRPDRPAALVLEIPAEYFQSTAAKDAFGQVLAPLAAQGVAMVAVITEGWFALPGSPAHEEHQHADRSLHEMREAGIEGVSETTTAWMSDPRDAGRLARRDRA